MINNIDIIDGVIQATDTDGYAVSELVTKNDQLDGDFVGLQNISAKYEFKNISESIESIEKYTDIVAEYKLHNNSLDTAGSNNGTDTNVLYAGSEAVFNGSSGIDTDVIYDNVTEFTLCLKFKTTNDTYQTMYRCGDSYDNPLLTFITSGNNESYITLESNDGDQLTVIFNGLTNGEWHMLSISADFNTGSYSAYLNDLLYEAGSINGTHLSLSGYESAIGYNYQVSNSYFTGSIKDILFYDKAKDAAFISNIFNNTFVVDTLKTTETIKDGDNLVIVKNDDSIHEVIASGVTLESQLDIFQDNSCIALFPFDNNANDYGGQYNGTWVGTEEYGVGKFDNAAKFDGPVKWISLDIQPILNEFQSYLSFWIHPNTTVQGKIILIDQNDTGWSNFNIWSENGILTIGGRNANRSSFTTLANLAIDIASWNHIVINKLNSSGDYQVYINNALVATFKFNFYIPSNPFRQVLGIYDTTSDSSNPRYMFDGLIDQIRIFNRTLSVEEINILYNKDKKLCTMDTTSITQGEVPSRAYRVDESVEFNGQVAIKDSDAYTNSDIEQYTEFNFNNDSLVSADGLMTITNNGGSFEDTPTGRGIYLDGADRLMIDYTIPGNNIIDISCVAKTNSIGSTYPNYLNTIFQLATGATRGTAITFSDDPTIATMGIGLLDRDDLGLGNTGVSDIIELGKYYIVRMVQDITAKTIKVYLDGGIILDLVYTGDVTQHTEVIFGNEANHTDYDLDGTIDNIKIVAGLDAVFVSTRTFDDLELTPAETIETKVQMSATGNRCTEIKADKYVEFIS